jgi:mRNA interferase RelE/StbE
MTLVYSDTARKQLKKMDKYDAAEILDYMDKIAQLENPFSRGHGLQANKQGIWRYRCQDWRILCEIQEVELRVIVLQIGHRRNVYD